jgi:putative ABC transport system permease protein
MRNRLLLLKWSWRDLRANWIKVAAIALVIALGTGTYAGLTSTADWRRLSNDASFGLLSMHDVRVELSEDTMVPRGALEAAAAAIPQAGALTGIEERLIFDVLVDASTADAEILVPGAIIGTDVTGGEPAVDGLHVAAGRRLGDADAGADTVLLEHNFASHYELPDQGTITISGNRELSYVGNAMTPEFFFVAPEGQIFFSEANYAALFTSLETAQNLGGRPGAVNDLVVTLREGTDAESVAAELEAAVETQLGVGSDTEIKADNPSFRALTEDVENDQQIYNLFAFLLFGGAVTGAFNLITRLVEQQRREIGAAMALGVPTRRIAVRPLLVGAQIALLGVAFGIGIGVLIGNAMRGVLIDFLPLPIWITDFRWSIFIGVAIAGFLVPFAASAWPVWRAVRVKPIEAIRAAHLTGGKRKRRRRFRRLPGSTLTVMPFRNLARARRRTALTMIGIAAIITVLVGFLGMVDSFLSALDRAEIEALGEQPDRISVDLDGFYPTDSEEVRAVVDASSVGLSETGLRAGGIASTEDASFTVLVELLDLDNDLWRPTLVEGTPDGPEPSLIMAREAAKDLGIGVGDTVSLRFPVRTGPDTFALASEQIPVSAIHPYPIRTFAFMDLEHADLFGLEDRVNVIQVVPGAGFDEIDVKRELLGVETVGSVQSVASATEAVRDAMGQIIGILSVVAVAIFVLALLIAFNSASINLDERFREHATMFAFGVRVRTALRMAITESLVIGLVATALGILGGLAMLWWVTSQLLSTTVPEFGVDIVLNPGTILLAVLLGVVAVALAPVLTIRRMRRMNLPGTLRLVE